MLGLIAAVAPASAASTPTRTLAAGSRFATPYDIIDSGAAGPTVMVVGGIHGNEPAGAAAAEGIRQWTVARGRLIVLPQANMLGLAADTRYLPDVEKPLADLNRDFPKTGEAGGARGALAKEIWRLVQDEQVAWLVDLHESRNFRTAQKGSVGNSILACPRSEVDKVLPVLLAAVNETIADGAKKYAVPRPPVNGTLARATAEHLKINSVLFETTKRDQPLEVRVRQHQTLVRRLLIYLEMMPKSDDTSRTHLAPRDVGTSRGAR